MLRYDSVDLAQYIYHAYALIVTEDATSDYSITPSLQVRWQDGQSVQPAVADGSTTVSDGNSQAKSDAVKLYQYHGKEGSFTFWRFKIEVPMADNQLAVHYSIDGQAHPDSKSAAIKDATGHTFFVPGKTQNFRWAGHSCNGFSGGVDQKEFNGPDPLWNDMLKDHAKTPFHAVIGGGDQIYCDSLTKEPEMQHWNSLKGTERMNTPLSEDIKIAIDRFMFNHYCDWFGGGAFAKTISQIPMVNMLDDHDLIDGFGTYPDNLMKAPVFNYVGSRGYFFFLLFQLFVNDDVDGVSETGHPNKSMIIGEQGVYIPFKNHSLLTYLGPKQWCLLVDCRSERKVDQICSPATYSRLFDAVRRLPAGVEHLIILLGVPLAYPRMVFLERTLSSSLNPLVMLAKGLSPGFTNNFNGQVELLDDLGDHWCAGPHKHERNWLVEKVQELGLEKQLRVSYISGDVHAAGVGVFFGYHQHDPSLDPKYSLAVITSAIVNTPPPPAVITMLNKLAAKKHRSLFYCGTKESMVPLFDTDLQGKKQNDKYIMGARNWCAVDYSPDSGELQFDIRVESVRGGGDTKSYPVKAPPPRWQIAEHHHHLLHSKNFDKAIGTLKGE